MGSSSLTKDPTGAPGFGSEELAMGPLGKYQSWILTAGSRQLVDWMSEVQGWRGPAVDRGTDEPGAWGPQRAVVSGMEGGTSCTACRSSANVGLT